MMYNEYYYCTNTYMRVYVSVYIRRNIMCYNIIINYHKAFKSRRCHRRSSYLCLRGGGEEDGEILQKRPQNTRTASVFTTAIHHRGDGG